MPPMRRAGVLPLVLVALCTAALVAADDDLLARARQLYNLRDFDQAIEAAEAARESPQFADRADLVAARAYLERYRETGAPADRENGRERLRRIDPDRLTMRERVELIVGLGQALYLDGAPGAAAVLFASVLEVGVGLESRERVLDWWATALDRDARPRPELDRRAIYGDLRDRMTTEISLFPNSSVAAYWLAAAAAGQGEWAAAWDAALSGWVRAPLAEDGGVALRDDLDRLMERAIVPQRARVLARPAEALQQEWDAFKARWTP
jgi:hypothetical protein